MHESAPPSSLTDATVPDQVAYDAKEAARVMGLGERTVWDLIKTGELESVKVGRARRITRAAIVAFYQRKREEPAA